MALDSANNKLYIANVGDRHITRFDSGLNGTTLGANQEIVGSYGSGQNQLNTPGYITTDSLNHKLYVADIQNDRVARFDSGTGGTTFGANWQTFGSYGFQQDQFGTITGLAVDTTNNWLYVGDQSNNRIIRIDSGAGATTFGANWTVGVTNIQTQGLALDSANNKIYAADSFNQRIVRFDSGSGGTTFGANFATFGSSGSGQNQFGSPRGIAVDSTNNKVYIGDSGNGRMVRVDSGSGGTTFGANWEDFGSVVQFNRPNQVSVDPTNNKVYVAENVSERISRFDSGSGGTTFGANLETFGTRGSIDGRFAEPVQGVFVDPTYSKIYIGDSGNHRIAVIDSGAPYFTGYRTSGTYVSGPIDGSAGLVSWAHASWSTSGTGTITIKARTGAGSDFAGSPEWSSCTSISSGALLTSGGCVTQGQRYIQYQATFSSGDSTVTPALDSITINYNTSAGGGDTTYGSIASSGCYNEGDRYLQYQATLTTSNTTATPYLDAVIMDYNYFPTNSPSLISSWYDSGDAENAMQRITWTGSEPAGTDIKYQLQTGNATSSVDAWSRRKAITVTNTTASTLTNYQANISVAYDSDMKTDFSDIRFRDSGGSTDLSFWLETATTSVSAVYWVKVPSIPASGATTIYMYYGNAAASSASNGDNTFTFFDGFDGASLDANKWTTVGTGATSTLSVSSGYADLISSDEEIVNMVSTNLSQPFIAETRIKVLAGGAAPRTRVFQNCSTLDITFGTEVGPNRIYFREAGGYVNAYALENEYMRFKETAISAGNNIWGLFRDGGSTIYEHSCTGTPTTLNITAGSNELGIDNNSRIQIDWVYARKYAATEPSTSTGAEENIGNWFGPDGTSSTYFTASNGSDTMPAAATDGSNDRYFRYKLFLVSDGASTPTLSDVSVGYIQNAVPEISLDSTPSQSADGTVTINYQVRDTDTNSGTLNGQVFISLEYWDGSAWQPATTVTGGGLKDLNTLNPTTYSSYSLVWNPKIDYNGHFTNSFKIRVKANDQEIIKNIAYATSSTFTLDTVSPVSTTFLPDADAGTITLAATDDSALQYKISNNADLSADGLNDDSGTWINYASDTAGSVVQTNDGATNTGFNLTDRSLSNIEVVGTEAAASLKLEDITYGDGSDGAITVSTSKNINTDTIATGRTCADGISYNVTALTSNTATLSGTPPAGCFAAGDKVMLLNEQGDGETNRVTYSVGSNVTTAVFDSSTNSIWVIHSLTNIKKFRASDGVVLGDYTLLNNDEHMMVFDSSTDSLWVSNNNNGNIDKIRASDGVSLGRYTAGLEPLELAFDSSTNSIWVVNRGDHALQKFRASDGQSLGTYPTGSGPHGIIFDPSTSSIWVANQNDSTLQKFRASDGQLLGTYSTGNSPWGVAFDSSTNSIWTSNLGPDTLTKFRASDGQLLGTYSTGDMPQTIFFDSYTNSIWVNYFSSSSTLEKFRASDGQSLGTTTVVGVGTKTVFDPFTDSLWIPAYNIGTTTMSRISVAGSLLNVGNYETLTVDSVSGTTVTFTTNKTKFYGNSAGDDVNLGTETTNQRVILQRIPQYTNVTVASGGTLTASAWDGAKGGVLAFMANGTVNVASGGTINMTGKGYRSIAGAEGFAYSGESYNRTGFHWTNQKNLGGGSGTGTLVCEAFPGGGGGYGTAGAGNSGMVRGGETYGSADLSKIFFGSAGGYSRFTPGGYGGGIVYLAAANISLSGSVSNTGNDGGGAGGSIFIRAGTSTLGSGLVIADGGADTTLYDSNCDLDYGGSYAGGDGRIHINSSSITGTTIPTADIATTVTPIYEASGTYTSGPIDVGGTTASWGNLSWSNSGGGTVTIKARSNSDNDFSAATAWSSCANITSGSALSTGNCVTDGHQYIQYQATFSTTDNTITPSVDSITIGYVAQGAAVSSQIIQTNEGATNTGFTLSGYSNTQTQVSGADTSAKVILANNNVTTTLGANQQTFPGKDLSNPTGIDFDNTHNAVFFADTNNHRIIKIDSGTGGTTYGANWQTFGSYGATAMSIRPGTDKFNTPTYIAADSVNNKLYVADTLNDRIVRMDSGTGGTTLGANREALNVSFNYTPEELVVDTDNNTLYLIIRDNGSGGNYFVARYDSGGGATTFGANPATFGSKGSGQNQFTAPVNIALDAANNKLFIEDHGNYRIVRIDSGTGGTTLGANWEIFSINWGPVGVYSKGLAVDTTHNKLYLQYDGRHLYVLDSGGGGTTFGGNPRNDISLPSPSEINNLLGAGFALNDLAIDGSNNKFYATRHTEYDIVYTFDSGEGGTVFGANGKIFGNFGVDQGQFKGLDAMTLDTTHNKLFAVENKNYGSSFQQLVKIDSGTGGTTLGANWQEYNLENIGGGISIANMVVDGSDNKIYSTSGIGNSYGYLTINRFDSGEGGTVFGANFESFATPLTGEVNIATKIQVDPENNKVYMSSAGSINVSYKIIIFDSGSDGTTLGANLEQIGGSRGSGVGQFLDTPLMALDTVNNKMYVADADVVSGEDYTSNHYRIIRFDSGAGGTTLGSNWEVSNYGPQTDAYYNGITIDGTNHKLYIADPGYYATPTYVAPSVKILDLNSTFSALFDMGNITTYEYSSEKAEEILLNIARGKIYLMQDILKRIAMFDSGDPIIGYQSSGTYVSGVIDTGSNTDSWGNLSWTASGTGTITLKARSNSDSDFSAATAWSSCTNITSGAALSTGGCVTAGHRYIQYQATLSTTDTSTTPALEDVTIGYTGQGGNGNSIVRNWNFDPSALSPTVYLMYRDAFGNVSATLSVGVPQAPQNPTVTDVSNTATSEWRLFVAWEPVTATPAGFASYKVYRSTDQATWTLVSTILNRAVNYYYDTNLDNTTRYYYRVSHTDSNSLVSGYSSTANSIPNGAGGLDVTAPSISSVAVSGITASGATITWLTNEISDSAVLYGAGYAQKQGSPTFSTSHSVTMTGLLPGTEYNIKVQSRDSRANLATDDNGGFGHTFTTLDVAAPVISARSVSNIGQSGATITWTTDIAGDSRVLYGDSFEYIAGSPDTGTSHSVALTGLLPSTTYKYKLQSVSADSVVGEDSNSDAGYTFTTLAEAPPAISNVDATPVTQYSATIVWNTDASSDSKVYFGDNYATIVGDPTMVTTHSVTISGLTADTAYTYKVSSTTVGGYTTEDDNSAAGYTFRTASENPPVISAVTVASVSYSSATITWDTNADSDSKVLYGDNYASFQGNPTLTSSHTVTMTGLSAATTYTFKVQSKDASNYLGEDSNSGDGYTFTTSAAPVVAAAPTPVAAGGGILIIEKSNPKPAVPAIFDVRITDVQARSATIEWTTDKDSTSFVDYGTTSQYEEGSAGKYESVKNHKVILKNLTPSTAYKAQARSGDDYGQIALSAPLAFTTQKSTLEGYGEAERSTILQGIEEIIAKVGKDIIKPLENALEKASIKVPPPTITGDTPRIEVTGNSVKVSWQTDREANGMVHFAPDQSYSPGAGEPYTGSTGNPEENDSIHTVTIGDLLPSTKYHFQLRSKSLIGGIAKSTDYVISTGARLPEFVTYNQQRSGENDVKVTWVTNVPTDSIVKYTPILGGLADPKNAKIEGKPDLAQDHEIVVKGLVQGSMYQFEIESRDAFGNKINKVLPPLTTGKDTTAPTVAQVKTESALLSGKTDKTQTIISWKTDEPSTTQVVWQEGLVSDPKLEQKTPLVKSYSLNHIVVITSFKPGTVYRFRVESQDDQGNITASQNYSVLTPLQSRSVIELILQNFEGTFGWMSQLKLY
jgi:DNA-binding beta-propeller fold protein YncE